MHYLCTTHCKTMCFFLEGAMLKYLNAYKNVNPMATISGKFCVPTEVRNK